ncbi:MAG: hypothetical protein M3541_20435 [Acidobacteriota bacterium]|nr:hypothetical protein [Acidobacteriota bacterium]MDQ3421107.1 hypothetical protein [Acidobacteriota bacterium]
MFVTVIREARRFEAGRATVSAWLCGIARNFVRRRLAVDHGTASLDDVEVDSPIAATAAAPLADLTSAEAIESLRRAVLRRHVEAAVLAEWLASTATPVQSRRLRAQSVRPGSR